MTSIDSYAFRFCYGMLAAIFEGISPIPSDLTLITARGGKKHMTVMLTRQPVPDDLTEVAVAVE